MKHDITGDPVAVVVEVVGAARPGIEPSAVADAVASVAGTRNVARRLARALADRPEVLDDGRSPAPKVVGQLLLELRDRGVPVAAPVCADCGRGLSLLLRRGEDWMCQRCHTPRKACASCGSVRTVGWLDRAGRPHCAGCPMDEEDPTTIALRVIARVDPALSSEVVKAALDVVVPRSSERRRLAWAIEDRPDLLTGAGAETPVPAVLRLIDELCAAGSTALVVPACPLCQRVVRLPGRWEGRRICRGCEARRHRVTCARCGKLRPPTGRDGGGGILCGHCFYKDPANHEECVGCGRRKPVCVRAPDGPRCENCRSRTEATCGICGEHGVCEVSKVTGQPWCRACQRRRLACSGCGQVRPVRSGTIERPLCSACTKSAPLEWMACPGCGEGSRLVDSLCQACIVRQRVDDLLADAAGTVRPELVALRQSMLDQRPETTLDWLRKPAVVGLLAELASGRLELSHAALDGAGPVKVVRHLRAVLVSTGALAARDEHMVRLEEWVAQTVSSRTDPEERRLLRRYASWHLIRRLRRRQKQPELAHSQAQTIKRHVRAAVILLDWLAAQNLTLASARQGDLERWMVEVGPARSADAGNFVRWARAARLTSLELGAIRWNGPSAAIDEDRRWEQARRLLGDDSLSPGDRVAGLLVLLYAQRIASVSRLTAADVQSHQGGVRLTLGDRPIDVPEPLAGLLVGLTANRRGHAAVGELGSAQWLFPGGRPGQPISASRLNERMAALGIRTGPSRTAALMQLATELPAAVIARMLGIHIKVAVQWQRLASGDWAGYAADYSRRTPGPAGATNHG